MEEDYKYVWEKARQLYRVVLDSPSYDRETKKTRHHYVTVGKALERGGRIDFGAKFLVERSGMLSRPGCGLPVVSRVVRCGERLVLDAASERTGLACTLAETLGREDAGRILQLAYHWNCTGAPFGDSGAWFRERAFPELPEAEINRLLRRLTEERCTPFLRRWTRRKATGGKVCHIVSSIGIHAVDMDLAGSGHDPGQAPGLRRIDLAVVADRKTRIPLAFRQAKGSLDDAAALADAMDGFGAYDAKPDGVVLAGGFWSEAYLRSLAERKVKFLVPPPNWIPWGRELIARKMGDVYASAPVDGEGSTYWCTVYDPLGERRRAWAHILYSPRLETSRKVAFLRAYQACRQELADGKPVEAHRKFYDAYFRLSGKRKDGRARVGERYRMDRILSEENFGCWILYTDLEKDAGQALLACRDRDCLEAGFDDVGNGLDGRRLPIRPADAEYGWLFIRFCALILRTGLGAMTASFSPETRKHASGPKELLDEVRSIARMGCQGRPGDRIVALSKVQRSILEDLGLDPDALPIPKDAGPEEDLP